MKYIKPTFIGITSDIRPTTHKYKININYLRKKAKEAQKQDKKSVIIFATFGASVLIATGLILAI